MLREGGYKLDFVIVLAIRRQLISRSLTKDVYIVIEVDREALKNLSGGKRVLVLNVILDARDLSVDFVKVSYKDFIALTFYTSVEGNSRD